MASIFVVDDDSVIRANLQEFLQMEGHEVETFSSGEDALSRISNEVPDLMLIDLRLPGIDGLNLLEKVKNESQSIQVVIITGHADISSAVKAIKLGARDYIKKPFDMEEISIIVHKAESAGKMDEHLAYLHKEEQTRLGFGEIIGTSEAIKNVFKFVRQVADSPKTTVLIRGETGTGKELVARAIHNNSDRSKNPFIEVNCSAFQETLLEAELFGHEAGAYTDAKERKKGLVELSHEGSFFLDEIGDMNLGLQSKVLKVIEEQVFRRVGGTKQISVDTRIISATSRDLEKLVSEDRFRQDLYYRLNVAMVELPPLRDRDEDIILLAEHFVGVYNAEFKRNIRGLLPEVKSLMMRYSWPGNVRELKNVIERAVLFEKGEYISTESIRIIYAAVNPEAAKTVTQPTAQQTEISEEGISLDEIEKSFIQKALESAKGNQTRAAQMLGISREKIKYRMKKHNLK
ncbi:MAG: sigma-54-dependent Fis family transcriptional regulator [Candidatus Marinimicrobia bacterium]|nr:sigma-54-dependent Fis family transcriptional regulator [Candidatus Neomarinimicrobiota bacterium]